LALFSFYLEDIEVGKQYAQMVVAKMEGLETGHGALADGYLYLGHAYRLANQLEEAKAAYEKAGQARLQAHSGRSVEPLAGLAQTALLLGDRATAVAYTNQILSNLNTAEFSGLLEPAWVYWVCFQVLSQVADERAPAVLIEAYDYLMTRSEKIEDPISKEQFFNNFPIHQKIRYLAQQYLSK
jgi:tetratricopeptide (TPR) repeat protein